MDHLHTLYRCVQICASVHMSKRAIPCWEQGGLPLELLPLLETVQILAFFVTKLVGDYLVSKQIYRVVCSLDCKNGDIDPVWSTGHREPGAGRGEEEVSEVTGGGNFAGDAETQKSASSSWHQAHGKKQNSLSIHRWILSDHWPPVALFLLFQSLSSPMGSN